MGSWRATATAANPPMTTPCGASNELIHTYKRINTPGARVDTADLADGGQFENLVDGAGGGNARRRSGTAHVRHRHKV